MYQKMTLDDHLERIESKGYSLCDFCDQGTKMECHWWKSKYGKKPMELCAKGVDTEGIEMLSWELGDD